MQEVLYIEDLDQAITILKPARIEILQKLDEPRTCQDLADYFGETSQKIYYHVKALETSGLVEKVEEKRVRGIMEGYYQAKAHSFWLAPQLIGKIGGDKLANDQVSLRVLLELAEEMQQDIGHLSSQSAVGVDVPSLSLSAHIQLQDVSRRNEFLKEVQAIFQELAIKYGSPDDDVQLETDEQGFRLILACYPKSDRE